MTPSQWAAIALRATLDRCRRMAATEWQRLADEAMPWNKETPRPGYTRTGR